MQQCKNLENTGDIHNPSAAPTRYSTNNC